MQDVAAWMDLAVVFAEAEKDRRLFQSEMVDNCMGVHRLVVLPSTPEPTEERYYWSYCRGFDYSSLKRRPLQPRNDCVTAVSEWMPLHAAATISWVAAHIVPSTTALHRA